MWLQGPPFSLNNLFKVDFVSDQPSFAIIPFISNCNRVFIIRLQFYLRFLRLTLKINVVASHILRLKWLMLLSKVYSINVVSKHSRSIFLFTFLLPFRRPWDIFLFGKGPEDDLHVGSKPVARNKMQLICGVS